MNTSARRRIQLLKQVVFFPLLILAGLFMMQAASAATGINEQIPFFGTLKNSSGTELSGSFDMVFRLYDAASGGTLLNTSTHTAANGNAVTVLNGEFSVLLGSGSGNTLTGVDFNDDTIFVGITVESDSEMIPRQRLGAVPYAFNTDTLDGLDSLDFLRSSGTSTISANTSDTLFTIQQSGTGDILNLFDGATEVLTVIDGGNVGIGTSSPASELDVWGDLRVGKADIPVLFVDSLTGRVGISTTTPGRALTIDDDIFLTGSFYDNSASAGTNGQVLQTTGSGVNWVSTSSLNIATTETNSLESTITGIVNAEIFIGTGVDSGAFAVIGGDATLANDGTLTLAAVNTNLTTLANVTTVGTLTAGTLDFNTLGATGRLASTSIDVAVLLDTELDTETELESLLTDVTNIFTNNDTITSANIADVYLLNTGDTATGDYTFTGTSTFATTTIDNLVVTNLIATTSLAGEVLVIAELNSEAELESLLADVANVFTSNDGTLADDDLSDDSINALSDITITAAANGEILSFNGSAWVDVATSSLGIALSDTIGTLAATRGGTGLSTVTQNQLLIGGAGNTWTQVSTSSLGLPTFADFDTEAELESLLTDVTNIFTNNDTITTANIADSFLLNTGDTATGDYAFDTDTLVIDSVNGRVGIGTTTPTERLTIIAGDTTSSQIALQSVDTGIAAGDVLGGIDFYSNDNQLSGPTIASRIQSVANRTHTGAVVDADLIFSTVTGTGLTLTEFMRFAGTVQRIGVGTSTPSEFFTIYNTGGDASFRVDDAAGDTSPFVIGNTGFVSAGTTTADAYLTVQTTGTDDILNLFETGGEEVFTVLENGNVGIGTTTPAAPLHVVGQVRADRVANQFALHGSDGSAYASLEGVASATSSGKLRFKPTNSSGSFVTRMTIDGETGNVGIGTTSPTRLLSVAGDAIITGSLYDSTQNAGTNGQVLLSTGSGQQWTSTSSLGLGDNTFLGLSDTVGSYTANRLLFASSSGASLVDSSALTFDGDIGQLTVTALASANGNAFRTITSIGDSTSNISQTDTAAPITVSSPGLNSGFSTPALVLNTYNDAGQGTQLLEFNRSKSGVVGTHTLVADGDVLGQISWGGSDGTNFEQAASIQAIIDGTPGDGDVPGALVFSTTVDGNSNSTERLRIDSSGNVGIASTTPSGKLTIQNTGTGNSFIVEDQASDATPFVIDASGNVGIGTTVPNGGFNIVTTNTIIQELEGSGSLTFIDLNNTNTGVGGIRFQDNGSSRWLLGNDGDNADTFKISQSSTFGTNDYFNILSGGSVGVGTSSPAAKLDVFGDFFVGTSSTAVLSADPAIGKVSIGFSGFSSTLTVSDDLVTDTTPANQLFTLVNENTVDGSYAGIMFLSTESGGGNRRAIIAAGQDPANSSAGYLGFHTRNGAITEKMRIDANGNVGIGTTTPDSTLNIHSGAFSSEEVISRFSYDPGSGAPRALSILQPVADDSNSPFTFQTNNSINFRIDSTDTLTLDDSQLVGIGTTTPSARLTVQTKGVVDILNLLETGGEEVFTVLENGRVGIGDTSPTALFTVGSGDLFQVNSGGAIAAATGITSSGILSIDAGGTQDGHQISALNIDTEGGGTPSLSADGGTIALTSDLLFSQSSASFGAGAGSAGPLSIVHNRIFEDIDFKVATSTNGVLETIFTIDSNGDAYFEFGNVAVGDTTPDLRLETVGISTDGYFGVSSVESGDGDIFIVDGDGNVGIASTTPSGKLTIQNTGTGNSFIVEDQAGDATPFVIANDGDVAIGKTAPVFGAKLDVGGNLRVSNGGIIVFDDNTSSGIRLLDSTNFLSSFIVGNQNSGFPTAGNRHIILGVQNTTNDASSQIVNIGAGNNASAYAGNAGIAIGALNVIGANAGSLGVQILGNSNNFSPASSAGGGPGGFILGSGNTVTHNFSSVIGAGNMTTANNQLIFAHTQSNVNLGGFNDIYFGTGPRSNNQNDLGTDVTINSSGAGDGTDLTGGDLILAGGKSTGAALGGDVLIQTADSIVSSSTLQSLSTKFIVKADGNVGIASTTPTRLLSVAGDAIITGSLYDSTQNAGTNGQVFLSTGSGQQWTSTSSLGLPTFADFDTETELESLLTDVTNIFTNNDTITTANIADSFLLNTGDTATGDYAFDTDTLFIDATGDTVSIGTTTSRGLLTVDGNFFVGTSSTPALFVDTSTGNVGIGSSTPSAKLTLQSGSFLQLGGTSADQYTPTLVGSVGIGTFPEDLHVAGRYAYVIDKESNDFKIIDVFDPTAPAVIGTLGIGDFPEDLSVVGRYAYVVDSISDDLKIIDVSDPANPATVGTLGLGSVPHDIFVVGRYAYVTDQGSNDLKIIDVSDPANPEIVGSVAINAIPHDVQVSGRYTYVVDQASDDLKVIDVSDPANPTTIGSVTIGQVPTDLHVAGRYAYVTDPIDNDFRVIDISDAANPTEVGALSIGDFPTGVHIAGRYAYVVDNVSDDLKVIDVSDPTTPVLVGTLSIGSVPTGVYIAGRYAYVVDSFTEDLKIIDISGIEVQSALAHSLEAGILNVQGNADIFGSLNIGSALNVGVGGVFANGGGSFTTASSTDLSGARALQTGISDSNTDSVVDVFSLGHSVFSTSSSAANGIGAGLLYTLEDDSGVATATARIASILTDVSTAAPQSALTFATKNTAGLLTEYVRINANGNMGLGDTSPDFRFETVGTSTNGYFGITNSTDGDIFIVDGDGNVGIASTTPSGKLTIQNTGTGNSFIVEDQASDATPFVIDASGNVGIGTTVPNGGFNIVTTNTIIQELEGSGSLTFIDLNNTNTGVGGIRFQDNGSSRWLLGNDGDNADTFKISQASTFGTNDYFNILSGGNVGIGSSSPTSLLSIEDATNPELIVRDSTNGEQLQLLADDNRSYIRAGEDLNDSAANLRITRTDRTATNIDFLEVYANDSFFNGNVGVGTTTGFAGLEIESGLGFAMYENDSGLDAVSIEGDAFGGQIELYRTGTSQIVIDASAGAIFNEQGIDHDFRIEGLGDENLFMLEASSDRVGIGTSTLSGKLSIQTSGTDDILNLLETGGEEVFTVLESGNVGIGTTSPGSVFPVGWSNTSDSRMLDIQAQTGSHDAGITLGRIDNSSIRGTLWHDGNGGDVYLDNSFNNDDGDILFRTKTSATALNALIIKGSGNVGIGTSTVTSELTVAGDIRVGTSGTNGCLEDFGGGVLAGSCVSDEALKTNITALSSGSESILENLVALVPVTYNWNGLAKEEYQKRTDSTNIGLLAQNVENSFPELVLENADGYKQVSFSSLPYYIIGAIKEMWEVVTGNREDITELQAENDALEARLETLEAALDTESEPNNSSTNSEGDTPGDDASTSGDGDTLDEGSDTETATTTETGTDTSTSTDPGTSTTTPDSTPEDEETPPTDPETEETIEEPETIDPVEEEVTEEEPEPAPEEEIEPEVLEPESTPEPEPPVEESEV